MEFEQPLVVAEALALTAIHDSLFGQTLAQIEQVARQSPISDSLISLQRDIHNNEKLRKAMHYTHGVNQVRDGLMVNEKEEFMRLMSAWKVQPHELEEKTAESLNSTCKEILMSPFLLVLTYLSILDSSCSETRETDSI